MEFIFECFYEDTLDKITRNGLQDRNSRRNVLDHLNAIIGGCSDGQNMNTEEVARLAVLAAVRYHREKKDANSDVCLMGKFHNILYIALRTCWEWGVRDSAVVVVLLEEIYGCEKTFERIFLGALFGPNAPHFIAGWRSDFRDQDENTRAMVYFLHHATSLDMTLPVYIARYEQERMVKFIDIPIESCGRSSPLRVALQASAPDLLLILLRYGAEPNPPDGGSSVILALLDKLIENGRSYLYQNVSCLQMLLRNVPQIELPYKPIIYETRREMFFQRYGNLLIDKIICKEQVYGVMSLRHLCRCRIRDILRSNGQLPDGIDTLRLPRRLQRYIDLMEEIELPDKDNKDDADEEDGAADKDVKTAKAGSKKKAKVTFKEPKSSKSSKAPTIVIDEVKDTKQDCEEVDEPRASTSASCFNYKKELSQQEKGKTAHTKVDDDDDDDDDAADDNDELKTIKKEIEISIQLVDKRELDTLPVIDEPMLLDEEIYSTNILDALAGAAALSLSSSALVRCESEDAATVLPEVIQEEEEKEPNEAANETTENENKSDKKQGENKSREEDDDDDDDNNATTKPSTIVVFDKPLTL